MTWTLFHAAWMHLMLAIFNAHDWTMCYVTTFTTEIFSLLNTVIYVHKAVQELQRAHAALSFAAFLYAIIGTIGTTLVAVFLSTAERWTPLFHRYLRIGLTEYAAAISIIIFMALPHAGELSQLDRQTLPVSKQAFRPSASDRTTFFVQFWHLSIPWVFAALIPGLIITVLFFFDHEVSSIICTLPRYRTKKHAGFAWDIVLLGTTMVVCGLLGIPPSNGLLPQAPLHSESLMHKDLAVSLKEDCPIKTRGNEPAVPREQQRCVYEQRWSPLLQAGAILAFAAPQLQLILGLTPTSVLAGLFLFMGQQSLSVNPILFRVSSILTPSGDLPVLPDAISRGPSTERGYWTSGIHLYTLLQILFTAAIFAVTLTKAAPAFPILIIACVPLRLLIMPRFWPRATLRHVDAWACKAGTPEDEL